MALVVRFGGDVGVAAVAVVVVAVVVVLVIVLAMVLAWCACRPYARCTVYIHSTYSLRTVYVTVYIEICREMHSLH